MRIEEGRQEKMTGTPAGEESAASKDKTRSRYRRGQKLEQSIPKTKIVTT